MRTLECGCEISPGGKLVSLCAIHGEHMHAVNEMQKHPRAEGVDRALQRELVKVLAPVVLARWSTVTDPQSSAQATLQHVQELMRRLD